MYRKVPLSMLATDYYTYITELIMVMGTEINPIAWWKSHTMELPKWAKTGMLQLRESFRFYSTLQLSSRNL